MNPYPIEASEIYILNTKHSMSVLYFTFYMHCSQPWQRLILLFQRPLININYKVNVNWNWRAWKKKNIVLKEKNKRELDLPFVGPASLLPAASYGYRFIPPVQTLSPGLFLMTLHHIVKSSAISGVFQSHCINTSTVLWQCNWPIGCWKRFLGTESDPLYVTTRDWKNSSQYCDAFV